MIERQLEKAKCKENWMKPRKKCADCNLSENGKWDMRERVREAGLYYLRGVRDTGRNAAGEENRMKLITVF